jgi:hypothetical protein
MELVKVMNQLMADLQGISTSCRLCVAWSRNLQQSHNKAPGNQSPDNLSLSKHRGNKPLKLHNMHNIYCFVNVAIAVLMTHNANQDQVPDIRNAITAS